MPLPSKLFYLLVDLGYNTGANGPAAFANSEANSVIHSNCLV